MRVVIPFRPFPPESAHHIELDSFDWMQAIRMLQHSVAVSCGPVPCDAITDVDTTLPVPMRQYRTTRRRLMLWTLDVCAAFLESDDFDQDTVMLDADQLVYRDLSTWFVGGMDLGVLVRRLPARDQQGFPVLNGVQFWAVRAKDRLAAFYRRALEVAEGLPESQIVWGADTTALQDLIKPYAIGETVQRYGLKVRMIHADDVLERCSRDQINAIQAGQRPHMTRCVVDFRNMRKTRMVAFYEATLGSAVAV